MHFSSLLPRFFHSSGFKESEPPAPLRLSKQIARLRWQVPVGIFVIVALQELMEHLGDPSLTASGLASMGVEIALYGFIAPAAVWLTLGWIQQQTALQEAAHAELHRAQTESERLNRRTTFLLKVSERLAKATDETHLSAAALQLPYEITPHLVGSALIRFDDHRQPMPVEYRGALDETALGLWHRHLSSRAVRQSCQTCHQHTAVVGQDCPMLNRLPLANVGRVVCRPLEHNGREYGILGIFLPPTPALTEEEDELFQLLLIQLTAALETARARAQELMSLYEINETLHERLGFQQLMTRILEQTVEASHADTAALLLRHSDGAVRPIVSVGQWHEQGCPPFIESLAAGMLREGRTEPLIASVASSNPDALSVICAPLRTTTDAFGVIAVGSHRPEAVLRRRLRLISTVANHAALLAQNAQLCARREHEAILNERGRLAREMHDGLAQTLGYLKMRSGQIARWVEAGLNPPAAAALHELHQEANNAYVDLRATLDGLRLPLTDNASLGACLRKCASDFESQTRLPVTVDIQAEPVLTIATQAHLLRLVQESLSNIRKHAHATTVQLMLAQDEHHLRLTITDNGQGFDTGQDPPDTRHGLRLMRERAGLLGAQLQITSAPQQGTCIAIDLSPCFATVTELDEALG